jgi:plastocyanin
MRIANLLLVMVTLLLARSPDAAPTTGVVRGTVTFIRDGKPASVADGYVYLVPVRKGRPLPPTPAQATIVQKNRKFTPDRVVIPAGSTVAFPNEEIARTPKDSEHNVFSPTTPSFDLSHYGKGTSKSKTFHDEGEYDIYCDIHVEMKAKVKVVDSDRIVRVVDGAYSFTDVPAGKYRVVAWAPDSPESKETITVVAGETLRVPQLNVQLGKAVETHLRKSRQPYGDPSKIYDK